EVSLRLKEHARLGLAALTALIPVMQTTIHCLNLTPYLRRFRFHPLMNVDECRFCHGTARNARLVRDDDHPVAGYGEQAQGFLSTGKPLKFIPRAHVMCLRRFLVEHTIPV